MTSGFPQTCDTCHNTTAWDPSTFDHSKTGFALTGTHLTTPCTQCHVNNNYSLSSAACATCHLAAYNTTTDPKHVTAGAGGEQFLEAPRARGRVLAQPQPGGDVGVAGRVGTRGVRVGLDHGPDTLLEGRSLRVEGERQQQAQPGETGHLRGASGTNFMRKMELPASPSFDQVRPLSGET